MSYFKHHVFFCCHQRDNGEACCNQHRATDVHTYAKLRIRELELQGPGRIRMNKAGCLDRCADGPVMVVYPDNVWYTYVDESDVDDIIQSHLIEGTVVERLRLPDPA